MKTVIVYPITLKPVIVYPVPMDTPETWMEFKPYVQRFTDSLREHPPGCPYELAVMVNKPAEETSPAADQFAHLMQVVRYATAGMFDKLPVKFSWYSGKGCDVGSYQHYASTCEPCFMVCCSSRVYAWRPEWLQRLVLVRQMFGPGLYTTSVGRETGRLHACCRCFGVDSADAKRYPHKIEGRGSDPGQGQWFENGDGCVLEWYQNQGLPTQVVYWDGVWEIMNHPGAHCLAAPNIWRRGNQSNLLVFDKHTDIYRDGDADLKRILEGMTFDGKTWGWQNQWGAS
jgi:hypothetical protein